MAEYMNNMPDAALDWDSEVTNEQREFVLLPAGDYLFTVQSFERARYEGSAKLPPLTISASNFLTTCSLSPMFSP